VFLINNMGGGGAERVVATLANHLSRALDWRITILTLQHGPVQYTVSSDVIVRSLRTPALGIGLGRVLVLPLSAVELARFLKRERPDFAMSFLVRSNLTLILTRWLGNTAPIVISERCATDAVYAGGALGARVMRRLVSALYPYASRIVAISGGVKTSLERLRVPGERVRVIYNPQDLEPLLQLSARGRSAPPGPFRIVTVGRLTDQKDYPTLFRAFQQVCSAGLDARLVILGEGPDEGRLRALAASLGIDGRIEWHGWIPSPHPVMSACDVFVLTSKYEGFGNVIVEAMACGLPVVCTDCESGPSEILEGGEHGMLVPVGDSGAVARAILTLASDGRLRSTLRDRGLARARHFDVAAIAQEYVEVLTGSETAHGGYATERAAHT
jgi:glycosyltransferase involved in cell wall biosynthesis